MRLRKKNSEYLNLFRKNLMKGTQYYLSGKKYNEAYKCLDTYLDCHEQPLFSAFDFVNTDTVASKAAYLAIYCAYKEKTTQI